MKLRTCFLLACGFLATSCRDDRLGGNSVETESDIAARVLLVDSLLPDWNLPEKKLTVATLRFDSGNFDFTPTKSDGSDLRLTRSDSTPIPFDIAVWDRVKRIGRLHVRLDSASLVPRSKIVLRWGDTTTASSRNEDSTWAKVAATQKLLVNSVLVDDFEADGDTSSLPTRPVWSASAGDSGVITGRNRESAGLGRSGKAMHIQFQTVKNGFNVFQTPLVAGGPMRSLRSLDSVELWLRGVGRVYVTFDHKTETVGSKTWTGVDLDSTKWVRVRLRPQDMDSANGIGGNVGWDAIQDVLTHFTLIFGNAGSTTGREIWIDDIRLYGVDRDDLR